MADDDCLNAADGERPRAQPRQRSFPERYTLANLNLHSRGCDKHDSDRKLDRVVETQGTGCRPAERKLQSDDREFKSARATYPPIAIRHAPTFVRSLQSCRAATGSASPITISPTADRFRGTGHQP